MAYLKAFNLAGLSIILAVLAAGCSRGAQENRATGEVDGQDVAQTPAVELPSFEVAADAPVLAEAFPRLASGALAYARLTPLPDGVFLRTETLSLGQDELDEALKKMPSMHRGRLSQNKFMLLEQTATGMLLEQEAKRALLARGEDAEAVSRDELLQTWMLGLVAEVAVGDAEIEAFYKENHALLGGATLDQIRPQLVQHLTQEMQQRTIETHIRDLGRRLTIALDADWVAAQDAAMRDNPVDRARDSGRPTLVSFGADSCRPCQMMKPFREAIAREYEGTLNVVYVHVNQDQMLASRYGVRGIPHVIFFDPDGREFLSQTGMMTQAQMEAVLTDMGVTKN